MARRSALSSSKVFSSSNISNKSSKSKKPNQKSTFTSKSSSKLQKTYSSRNAQKHKKQFDSDGDNSEDEDSDNEGFGAGGIGKFDPNDDEEIDSDEAWGEGVSDEEPLQLKNKTKSKTSKLPRGSENSGKVSKGKGKELDDQSKPTKRSQPTFNNESSDSEENEEEDLSGDPEDYLDPAAVLDQNIFPSSNSDSEPESSKKTKNKKSISFAEPLSSEEDEFDEIDESKLESFISSLPSLPKRSRDEGESEGDVSTTQANKSQKRRKTLKERSEAWDEADGEGWVNVVNNDGDSKVTFSSLLSSLPTSISSSLSKSLKPLTKSSSRSSQLLSAPLPSLHQNRLERSAAYSESKSQVDKWDSISKVMRGEGFGKDGRKERLVFPLRDTGDGMGGKEVTGGSIAQSFKPMNDLEASITSFLSSQQLSTKAIQQNEEQALQALTPKEAAERIALLRLERDLLFRKEMKDRRKKKIKSKSFRKVHKKSKDSKSGENDEKSLQILSQMDSLDGGTRAQAELERLEMERVKERMSLRHSGSSKDRGASANRWMRSAQEKVLDGLEVNEVEEAKRERQRMEERLRRKILGDDAGDDDDSEDEVDEDNEESLEQGAAFASLVTESSSQSAKGIHSLKFMQKYKARQDVEAEEVRKALEEGEDDDEEIEEGADSIHAKVGGNKGRMVFTPALGTSRKTIETSTVEHDACEPKNTEEESNTSPDPAVVSVSVKSSAPPPGTADTSSNPWLSLSASASLVKSSKKRPAPDSVDAGEKMTNKLKKHKGKSLESRLEEEEDARVEIDLDEVSRDLVKKREEEEKEEERDIDIDQEIGVSKTKKRVTFKQRDLIEEAFAGDDVVAAFQEEKRLEIERDAPQEEDLTLPGWGTWVGKSMKKSKSKPIKKFTRKIAGIDPSQRKDSGLPLNVIISEKKDKKAAEKYLLKDLPFPFTSSKQYDHLLEKRVGLEWNSRTEFEKDLKKDVEVKMGAIILPLDPNM